MKYSEVKEKTIPAYTFLLNNGLIIALQTLYDYWDKWRMGAELGKLGLTNSQYVNFNQLQNFGLATKVKRGGDEKPVRYPTQNGRDFLLGRIKRWDRIATLDDEVLPQSHPARQTDSKKPTLKWVWELADDIRYKQHAEYAKEKGSTKEVLFNR